MDQFHYNSHLSYPDYGRLPQLTPSFSSTETLTPSPNASALTSAQKKEKAEQAARRREQNRLAQRRHREKKKKKKRLEEGKEPHFVRIEDNTTTPLAGSHNAQDPAYSGIMSLQKYRNTDSHSSQSFPDERIIFMPTYNVTRALVYIAKTITHVFPSFKFDLEDQSIISPVNSITLSDMTEESYVQMTGTSLESSLTYPSSSSSSTSRWAKNLDLLPENLRPTKLQLSIPHHPSVDVIPWPSFRDKLLLMGHLYEDHSFCIELFHELLVWGNRPELDDNWEITPRFAQHFWLLIEKDTMKRTNWWRAQRNLPSIDLDAISRAQNSRTMTQQNPTISLKIIP